MMETKDSEIVIKKKSLLLEGLMGWYGSLFMLLRINL